MDTSSKKMRPTKSKHATLGAARPSKPKPVRGKRDAANLSLKELGEEFAKHRVTDETKLTPLQRRMTSGGA